MLTPGTYLARYRILRLIGRGRHTEVYEVLAPDGKRRALKVIEAAVPLSSTFHARLAQEAEALAMIDHVHVVHFFDAGVDHGQTWLVEELVEGPSLRDLLVAARGPLPVEQAVRFIKQAAEGMAAVHARSILHRDLRPEKILVAGGEVIKVADFGAAKLDGWGVRTEKEQSVVSSLYMAPEHMKTKVAERASDVYALGLILYELLTGEHPIAPPSSTAFVICQRQLFHAPPSVSSRRAEVPGDVAWWVEQALAKDAALRPTMQAFAEGLGTALRPLQMSRRAIAWAAQSSGEEPALAKTEMSLVAWEEAKAQAQAIEAPPAVSGPVENRSAVLPPAPSGAVTVHAVPPHDQAAMTLRSASESWAGRGATPAPLVRNASRPSEARRSGWMWAAALGAAALLGALGVVGWALAEGGSRPVAAAGAAASASGAPAAPAAASADGGAPRAKAGGGRFLEEPGRGGSKVGSAGR